MLVVYQMVIPVKICWQLPFLEESLVSPRKEKKPNKVGFREGRYAGITFSKKSFPLNVVERYPPPTGRDFACSDPTNSYLSVSGLFPGEMGTNWQYTWE
jgi:hypothetical protein